MTAHATAQGFVLKLCPRGRPRQLLTLLVSIWTLMRSPKYIKELNMRFRSLRTQMKSTQYFRDRPCSLLKRKGNVLLQKEELHICLM